MGRTGHQDRLWPDGPKNLLGEALVWPGWVWAVAGSRSLLQVLFEVLRSGIKAQCSHS